MTKEKTIYCGSGKKQNETWFKVTVSPDKMRDHIQEFNGKKFIRLNINVQEKANEYGKDISVSVDTWQPDEAKQAKKEVDPVQEQQNDLPF